MDMVRCLTTVAAFIGSVLLLAGPGAAAPVTGHSESDAVLDAVDIGSVAQGRIGDRGGLADTELGLGQTTDALLFTGQFDWTSGETYDWTLSYELQSVGGAVRFELGGFSHRMPTTAPFNSFFIRAAADLPGTRITVSNLVFGPPPSAGGGGNSIFESGNPTMPAVAIADGDDAPLDILKISGVDLSAGFTLGGQVTMVFAQADPPVGEQLVFEVFAADDGNPPGVLDSDGDGVEDSADNCPEDTNPDQANADGDVRGDVCDNCPNVFNNPGADGKQADGDDDGAGDLCDNCPVGCTVVFPPTASCKNPDQFDTDGDEVGDRCDNCRFTKNGPNEPPPFGDQADTDENLVGDACEPTTVILNLGAAGGGGASGSGGGSGLIAIASAAAVECVAGEICISLECAQDVESANIGLALPADTSFDNFGGCTANPGDPPPPDGAEETDTTQKNCSNAGADLGGTIDKKTSFTIGPMVQTPAGFPELNVVLRLKARPGELLCVGGLDPPPEVFLGKLRLNNLPEFSAPTVSTEGFNLFGEGEDALKLLEGPGGADFPEAQILTQVVPADPFGTLTLRPATTPSDFRSYKLSILSERRIHKIAFGITTSSPPAGPVFGGCNCVAGDATCGGDFFPAQVNGFDLTGCPDDPANVASGVLGTGILTPTDLGVGFEQFTFVARRTVEGAPFPPNTIYIALEGLRQNSGLPSINNPSATVASELGIIEFSEDTATPQITFFGADTLPGFDPGGQVVQSSAGNPIAVGNVSLLNRSDADEDLDGDGVGDDSDNCVLTQNGGPGGQQDSGGVAVVDPDDIGDPCQCGDGGGDGIVGFAPDTETTDEDVLDCQNVLALPPGTPSSDPEAAKCQVTVGEQLSIVDLVILDIEAGSVDSGLPDTAGRLQACGPATELQ
jgi:hypothetical protein